MADDVLNPTLYRALQRACGRVKVHSPGVRFEADYVDDYINKEKRVVVRSRGEQYAVCCPCCTDTRYRLHVNHMWGKRDQWERPMFFLATCFNETQCMQKYENREHLMELLCFTPAELQRALVKEGQVASEEERVALPPGPCQRLDTLPADHPARLYLQVDRGFDPDFLAHKYGVSYCSDSHYADARNRIIIPIVKGGVLKGWQARYIGELNWKHKQPGEYLPPKYFTMPGFRKSRYLYNWEQMRKYRTGVIVEGTMDAWSMGPMCGAVLGPSIAPEQRALFATVFKHGSGVWIPDPEEYDKPHVAITVADMRRRMSDQFACIKLPEGTDPGKLDQTFLREYVAYEAYQQGVHVSWELA